jgi:hypothetical protein
MKSSVDDMQAGAQAGLRQCCPCWDRVPLFLVEAANSQARAEHPALRVNLSTTADHPFWT